MPQPDDLSRSLTPFVQGNTLVAVIELSLSSWLMTGLLPGVARQPLKKLNPDESELLRLLHRWQDEAVRNGSKIDRIVVAYEAGRDGFWLARWYKRTTSRLTSSTPRALLSHASIDERRPIGWTPPC